MEPTVPNEVEARTQALIVDNSKGLRLLLGWILQEVGIEAVEAGSGTEALQILGTGRQFSVVILDWDLPGINGIQVATAIRRDEKLKSLPIMMISGRPHSSDADYALRAGVNDYVIKPFTRETILHSLARMGLIES